MTLMWIPMRSVQLAQLDEQDIDYLVSKFLHMPRDELVKVLERLTEKLKQEAVIQHLGNH